MDRPGTPLGTPQGTSQAKPPPHPTPARPPPAARPEGPVDRELGIEIAICGDPKDHSSTELFQRLRR